MKPIHPSTMKIVIVILAVLFVLSVGWLTYGNIRAGSEAWQLVLSTILISIPIGLFYSSIGLLVAAGLQRRARGQIDESLAKIIYRAPRIAGIAIIIFVGLFSLDVFTEGYSLWEMLGGFIMHSLPAIAMAVTLALAWRRPLIGFLAFAAAATFFLRFVLGNPMGGIGILLLFSGPMAAIAMLFWADWRWIDHRRPAPVAPNK